LNLPASQVKDVKSKAKMAAAGSGGRGRNTAVINIDTEFYAVAM
jgi:hypothetical protein